MKTLSYITAVALCLIFTATAMADDYEDFKKLFEDVTGNFKEAVSAGGDSRVAKEYTNQLRRLEDLASKIQAAVTRLKIEDVNLPRNVTKIKEIYVQRTGLKSKASSGKSFDKVSGLWFPVGQIREDIHILDKMGFSSEKGGSYKKELAEKSGLDEFTRLVDLYQRNIVRIPKAASNSEWRALFEKRLSKMKLLSRDIQTKLARENPAFAKDNNLSIEVNYLSSFYADLTSIYSGAKEDEESEFYDDKTGKSKTNTQSERLMKDVNFTLKRLHEMDAKLRDMNFSLEGKSQKAEEDGKKEDVGDGNEPEDSTPATLDDMDLQLLNKHLTEERDRIYKSNYALTGISPVIQKYYIATLTGSQKSRYNELVKKYTERGYKSEMARSSALLELHGMLRINPSNSKKEEIIKILKKIEAQKEDMEKDIHKERFDHKND